MTKRYKTITNAKSLKILVLNLVLSLFYKPFKTKRAVLPLLALFFSPIGIIILVILALLIFGFIGFGVFLALNLFAIGGIILVIAGLIAVVNGQINQFTITIIILGVFLLISPMLFDAIGNLTLAAVLE